MKTALSAFAAFLFLSHFSLAALGQSPTPTPDPRIFDLAPSGLIDSNDLRVFSLHWFNDIVESPPFIGDFDNNGEVDANDLLQLILAMRSKTEIQPSTPEEIITIDLPNLTEGARPLRLVRIPRGAFEMGSPDTERGRFSAEGPVHSVTLTYDFYFGETEVTQAQWMAVMGNNPATDFGVGEDHPVYYVSWNDCQDFIAALNSLGQGVFRLPSEAEWEYACRAGTDTRFSFGDNLSCDDLCGECNLANQYMWWCGNNSPSGAKPVAGKLANAFGLHDMHGNVWEHCEDHWHSDYNGAPTDGQAWESLGNITRVYRGGDWFGAATNSRSANRFTISQNDSSSLIGLRVVRTAAP